METQALSKPRAVRRVEDGGDRLARSDGFEWLARAGFAARGVVYVIIGILAVKLALGSGGATANQQGALRTIAAQPFGNVLLILVAVGLGGYALWRLVRALLGHGPEGSDSGVDRVAAFASGVVYAGLCAIAVEILLGSDGGSNSAGAQRTTAGVSSAGSPGPGSSGSPAPSSSQSASTRDTEVSAGTSSTTRRQRR